MKAHFIVASLLVSAAVMAQSVKTLPSGGNKRAQVAEQVGITDVSIRYSRPGVKGREGKIYGTSVVHKGFEDLGFGSSKASPWRAGANENTTIEFSTPVKIEGKELPAGRYGFFIAYDPNECTLIFSKNSGSWGSYFYSEQEDALRVKVKPVSLSQSVEWLKYEFTNQTDNSAVVMLEWEKTAIPFKIETDLFQTRLANFRLALRGDDGFRWEKLDEAAKLCLNSNSNLDEGLLWSNTAVSFHKNFATLSTNAGLLERTGRQQKADSVMRAAQEVAGMIELHQYGRKLISEKKSKEALEVFKLNARKNPKQFITYAGLARGYSATGDYKNALTNAKLALALAPDELNKTSVEGMIQKLEKGTDVN